jgi:RND family efflux transporter MFP subunit
MAGQSCEAFLGKVVKALREGAKGPALKKAALALGGVLALVLLLLWIAGTIGGEKVAPGTVKPPVGAAPAGRVAAAEKVEVEELLEWPGTVRSRMEARPASKLLARVLEVKVRAGDPVKAGDVLAVLDDRDVRSRVDQARSALASAEAQAAQAGADHARVKGLFDKQAATQRDLEAAEARAKSAAAQVAQARDAVKEAEVALGEGVVKAPFDGVVAEKLVEPGDTAVPGRPLFTVHDPSNLRLEAQVPESCAAKASVGMEVRTRIDALGREVTAKVEEISPVADPQSRTFLIKAALPPEKDLRPGTFGRFLQPCGKKTALLIPLAAVSRSGQLEMVKVLEDGEARTRHVKTGKTHGDRIEVLSGLREGDKVLVEAGRP